MKPDRFTYRKVEFVGNGTFEVTCITEDWDKHGGFNETLYLHLVNLGWESSEASGREGGAKP